MHDTGTPEAKADPFAALQAVSPCSLDADTLPRTMAALQVAALFGDEGEHLYAGPLTGAKNARYVHAAGDFMREVAYGGRFIVPAHLPELVLPNPITGRQGLNKDGTSSYRCEATVSAFRHICVEFDGMDAPGERCRKQALFWRGVVTSRTKRGQKMPLPVRCLVFSGSKSIHAALRVDAADGEAWGKAWETLAGTLPGLDSAFRSPAQCMRIAGAVRNDEKVHRIEQTLLWCVPPAPAWGELIRGALSAQIRR
jgi:hypothetical protein